ncbi:tripartite tricarboxylate transporter TctB family protein [Ensifer sp. IC4062]|nr:tripartite tricarboxylate transporter TctB family protein [Ensifer sp. IC4062]
MQLKTIQTANRPAAVVAVVLFAIAAVTWWDASHMTARATYGMSASAASYLVAVFFVALGLAHLVNAFKPADIEAEAADWGAIGWIGVALAGLIGAIWLGGGFVLGSTLLFAFTTRAFGRRALLVDLCFGAVLAVLVFFLFNKLLTLALPMGPLERLF